LSYTRIALDSMPICAALGNGARTPHFPFDSDA